MALSYQAMLRKIYPPNNQLTYLLIISLQYRRSLSLSKLPAIYTSRVGMRRLDECDTLTRFLCHRLDFCAVDWIFVLSTRFL